MMYTNELTGRLADARRMGMKVAIVSIPVRLMTIDPTYQTEIRTSRELNYLVKDWDDNKLLPVVGVPHDEEGKIYLVDGYGRLTASQIVDKEKYQELFCMVILNAPTEPKLRQRFEAEQYAFQNKNVAKVTPIQKHGALRIMHDPAVEIMDELKDKYGFEYSKDKGNRGENVIGSYTHLYRWIKSLGKDYGDWMFDIFATAGFNRKPNGYASYLIDSFKDLYKLYPTNRNEIADYLGKELRKATPLLVKSNAVSRYPVLCPSTAVSMYLEDEIVKKFGYAHKREVKGTKVIPVTA